MTEYSVKSFDPESKTFIFSVKKNNEYVTIGIEMPANYFHDYRKVGLQTYKNIDTNDIVIYNPVIRTRLCIPSISDDSGEYILATQYEFDKWHIKHHPNTANAFVYGTLERFVNN